MRFKSLFFIVLIMVLSVFRCEAQLSFSGTINRVLTETPDASSGLSMIYVLDRAEGVIASYTATNESASVRWLKFSALGGGYAEEVSSSKSGNVSSITLTGEDMGYIVEEGTSQKCYWIVNYANHTCELRDLSIATEQDCMSATLLFSGKADKIGYYTINGVPRTLSRGLTLEYSTLTFNSDRNLFEQVIITDELEFLSNELHVTAPLCQTDFLLTGDRFQREWGRSKTISSPTLEPKAIEAFTTVTQSSRSVDNELNDSGNGSSTSYGGSAPVEITFSASVTDAAIYHEWQFASDPQFDIIDMRVNSTECTRVFTEYGTIYARFVAGDNSGLCDWTSETYVIYIGESKLECPNAFSPGSSEGCNDEWKVSYKSIIDFDCHIFNRWGVEVAHLTDPSQGWDGHHNGKLVKSGVFYYVIQAEGADGKKYNLSGDINIIRVNYNKGY